MFNIILEKTHNFFTKHNWLKKILLGLLLFIVIWICYDVLVPYSLYPNDNFQTIRTVMIIPPCICLALGCYWYGKKELNVERLALLLMIAGFSLRIGYAFYTGADTRQHDVEMWTQGKLNIDGAGHFAYTNILYTTMKLPETVRWQFYHPPFWHFLVAIWMHIYSFFTGVKDVGMLYEAGMILSSFVGCLTLIGFKKLLFSLTKNNKVRIIALFILCFHSQFFIQSSWMNNDGLSLMFSVFSLYFGLRFHQDRKWKDIILCALSLGLGAMTKVSIALMCIPLAMLFIYDFVIDIKDGKWKRIILQYVSFVAICAPLALWFIIRNITLFGIESIGVPYIDPNTNMGVINYTLWERFGIPDLTKLNESIFCIIWKNQNGYHDYNVWLYSLKCSVLGEYSYWQGTTFINGLLLFNGLMIVYSLYCMVYTIIHEWKKKDYINLVMVVIFFVNIISYIIFQVTYPVICTQDFRYMTMILLPGAYFIGKHYANIDNGSKLSLFRKAIALLFIIGFALSSILTFISVR